MKALIFEKMVYPLYLWAAEFPLRKRTIFFIKESQKGGFIALGRAMGDETYQKSFAEKL